MTDGIRVTPAKGERILQCAGRRRGGGAMAHAAMVIPASQVENYDLIEIYITRMIARMRMYEVEVADLTFQTVDG